MGIFSKLRDCPYAGERVSLRCDETNKCANCGTYHDYLKEQEQKQKQEFARFAMARDINLRVRKANEHENLLSEIRNLKKRVKKLEEAQDFTKAINEVHKRIEDEVRVPRGFLFPDKKDFPKEFDTPWTKKGKEWELVDDKVRYYLSLPRNACQSECIKKALEDAVRYGFMEGERFGKYEKGCQSIFDRAMETFINAGEEDCGNKGGK